MKTYIVEDKSKHIIEYCRTLQRAKVVLDYYDGNRIIMMIGRSFGEGVHKYQLIPVKRTARGVSTYVRWPL